VAGLVRRASALDALLDAIENLQGAPLPASILESEILSARVGGYSSADLDASGGRGRSRVARCRARRRSRRARRALSHRSPAAALACAFACGGGRAVRARAGDRRSPRRQGASFFAAVHDAAGGGYPGETVEALWDLVWKGIVTNDTFHALRAFTRAPAKRPRKRPRHSAGAFRSRRVAPPSAEGRWFAPRRSRGGARNRHRVVRRDGAAVVEPLRGRHA
jgi:ATP-dependent Lhr-like helicase